MILYEGGFHIFLMSPFSFSFLHELSSCLVFLIIQLMFLQPIFSVHGMEYGFGAHDFPISGVFEVEPKTCPGFSFKRSISLGQINMPPSEFRTFVETMASEYHGNTYHLISKNCNHFTDDIAWRLTGKHIPGWVNRLARLGMLSFAHQIMFLFMYFFRFKFSKMITQPWNMVPYKLLHLN